MRVCINCTFHYMYRIRAACSRAAPRTAGNRQVPKCLGCPTWEVAWETRNNRWYVMVWYSDMVHIAAIKRLYFHVDAMWINRYIGTTIIVCRTPISMSSWAVKQPGILIDLSRAPEILISYFVKEIVCPITWWIRNELKEVIPENLIVSCKR